MKALVVEVAICTGESHQLKPISLSLTSPMCTIGVLPTSKTVAGGVYYNNGKIALASVAPSLSSALPRMSFTSYWKGKPGKTQKPPRKDPSTALSVPKTPVDGSWTLMDADGPSPPTYPEVHPQEGPARTALSAHSSTEGETRRPIVMFFFSFFLLF